MYLLALSSSGLGSPPAERARSSRAAEIKNKKERFPLKREGTRKQNKKEQRIRRLARKQERFPLKR